MKKKKRTVFPITMNGKDFMNILIPKLKVLLEGSPRLTDIQLSDLVMKKMKKIFLMVNESNFIVKFDQLKFAESVSGKIGDTSYADSDKIQSHGRRLPSKSPVKTPARLVQQNRLRIAESTWKSEDISIINAWNKAAESLPLNGCNLHHGIFLCLLKDNKPIPSPFLPTPELLSWYKKRKPRKKRF